MEVDVHITDNPVVYGCVQINRSTLHMDGTTPISGKVIHAGVDLDQFHGKVVRIEVVADSCDNEWGVHTIPHKGCLLR